MHNAKHRIKASRTLGRIISVKPTLSAEHGSESIAGMLDAVIHRDIFNCLESKVVKKA
jgi:hypothetical protein